MMGSALRALKRALNSDMAILDPGTFEPLNSELREYLATLCNEAQRHDDERLKLAEALGFFLKRADDGFVNDIEESYCLDCKGNFTDGHFASCEFVQRQKQAIAALLGE